MKTGFLCRINIALWAALLLPLGLGHKIAKAQVVEPIFPLPNSTHDVSTQPIEFKLTEQPEIKLDSIQVKLNDTPLDGSLSVNTSELSLTFQATPPNYNLGTNTLTVQLETQSGVQSQFSWPFNISTVTAPEDTATPAADAVSLTPEFTTQSTKEDTLVLSGTTQPGATVTLTVTATIPATSLVDLGPFSVTTEAPEPRQMSDSVVADGEGIFKLEFDVTGDPAETDYQIDAIATQGDAQESTSLTLQR